QGILIFFDPAFLDGARFCLVHALVKQKDAETFVSAFVIWIGPRASHITDASRVRYVRWHDGPIRARTSGSRKHDTARRQPEAQHPLVQARMGRSPAPPVASRRPAREC